MAMRRNNAETNFFDMKRWRSERPHQERRAATGSLTLLNLYSRTFLYTFKEYLRACLRNVVLNRGVFKMRKGFFIIFLTFLSCIIFLVIILQWTCYSPVTGYQLRISLELLQVCRLIQL